MAEHEMSLAGFAAFATALGAELVHRRHKALEEAAKLVETEAKRVIGTYDYNWPPLAESTKRDRVAKGFAEDEPLLRTGEMRDSIEHTVTMKTIAADEAQIGSNNDKAVWQELGTSHIPARSFLAGAAAHKEKEIVALLGHHVEQVLLGGTVLGRVPKLP